jgi:lysophospholipase L1-like esterase
MGQAVKIMPLGDSITRGSNSNGAIPGGYRRQLGVRIAGASHSYDFVGVRTDNAAVGMDPDHNGRDGYRTDQVLAVLTTYLAANPNVVLMHLGTNDLIQAVPTATVITNMTTLIQRITSHSTNPKLYVATIIPILADRDGKTQAQWATTINDYNSKVRLLVQQQAALGRNVSLVDFASTLSFTIGTSTSHFYHINDGTHPNQNGYNKMGDLWYSSIVAGGSLGAAPPPSGTGEPMLPSARLLPHPPFTTLLIRQPKEMMAKSIPFGRP